MKKLIKIIQENVEHIIIEDENDEDLNEYSLKLSNLLSVGNVIVLETTTGNIILRPNKIVSITVIEEGRTKRSYKKKDSVIKEIVSKEEDIITDED